jgi:hypothetical protein
VRRLAVLALAPALVLAGCGLAVGSAPSGVQLLVTREFGASFVRSKGGLHAETGETALGLLRGIVPAQTASPDGEGAVLSVDGLADQHQRSEAGQGARWVYYVNGVQAPKTAALTPVHPGDHVWWDLHDMSQAPATPAVVVGAFPEPFLNGIEGKRLPVRVECTSGVSDACSAVTAALRKAGVPAAITAYGTGEAPETLRVIVGPWALIDGDIEAQTIDRGPSTSGVYAQFASAGQRLTLLDEQGAPVRTLTAGAGLIAATQRTREAPVWVITGTDDAGVELAARALNRKTLERRFAVALQAGATIPLPISSTSAG